VKVTITPIEERVPEQRIVLELSVEEFAMLNSLRYTGLSGSNELRKSLEVGFTNATNRLHPHWGRLVRQALGCDGVSSSYKVSKIFRDARQQEEERR
jgi:hypothetical protein